MRMYCAVAGFARARVFCAMVALETTMVPRAEVREDAQHLALAAQGCDTRFCMFHFSLLNLF